MTDQKDEPRISRIAKLGALAGRLLGPVGTAFGAGMILPELIRQSHPRPLSTQSSAPPNVLDCMADLILNRINSTEKIANAYQVVAYKDEDLFLVEDLSSEERMVELAERGGVQLAARILDQEPPVIIALRSTGMVLCTEKSGRRMVGWVRIPAAAQLHRERPDEWRSAIMTALTTAIEIEGELFSSLESTSDSDSPAP